MTDLAPIIHRLKYTGIDWKKFDSAVRIWIDQGWKIVLDNHESGRLCKKIVNGKWCRFVYYPDKNEDGIPIKELIGEPDKYVRLADDG